MIYASSYVITHLTHLTLKHQEDAIHSKRKDKQMKTLAIDLGGTKIATGVIENGNILLRSQASTPRNNYKAVLDKIISEAESLLLVHGDTQAIGLGVPGIIDYKSGNMLFANNLNFMQNVPIAKDIEKALGYPVFIENDAKAAGLGERVYGAAKHLDSSIFITISTGIGGVIFLGDTVIRGFNNTAGEIGHIAIKDDSPRCSCGNYGCWEVLASGTAIARSLSQKTGRKFSTKEVFDQAKSGNDLALAVVNEAAKISGKALTILQKIYDPEGIVIGGGVSMAGNFYLDKIQKAANYHSKNFPSPLIIPAKLSTNAGLVGAASVAEVAMKKLLEKGLILTNTVRNGNYDYL